MKNTIEVFGEVGKDVTLASVKSQYNADAETVDVVIDSIGGNVYVGYEIRDFLQVVKKSAQLNTIIIGDCASIATHIALVADFEDRYIKSTASYMIHNAFGAEITCDADCYRSVADELDSVNLNMVSVYVKKTGLTREEVEALMKVEKIMTAHEAKQKGFVAHIINQSTNQIQVNMKEEEDNKNWLESKFEKVSKALANLTKKVQVQAMKRISAKDAEGNDAEMFLGMNPEDEDMVGKKAMNPEGEPMATGTYKTDTAEITIDADGVISDVVGIEAMDEEEKEEEEEEMVAVEVTAKLDSIMKNIDTLTKVLASNNKATSKVIVPKSNKTPVKDLDHFSYFFLNRIEGKYEIKGLKERLATFRNASVVTDNFNYTYDGQLSTDILYKPSVSTPDFTRLFTVRDGVRSKQQLLLAGNLSDKIIKLYQGCKNVTLTSSAQVTIFNRTLEVAQLEVFLEQCADVFDETILEEWKNLGVTAESIEGTQFQNIVLSLILDAMRRGLFRIFSWGSTADANTNYNQLDGLWTRLIASQSEVSEFGYCGVRVDNITVLNQTANTRAYDYIKNLYEAQSSILRQMPSSEKAFFVTPNILDNYAEYREQLNGADVTYRILDNGEAQYYFRGIPVYEVTSWRDHLEDADNPYFGLFNTCALLTTPKNHIIGLSSASAQRETKLWYSWDDNVNKIKALPEMGYNYAHCDLQVFSYGQV